MVINCVHLTSTFLECFEVLNIPCQVFPRKGWKCGHEVGADDICVLALRKGNFLYFSRSHHPTQFSWAWNSNQPSVQKDKSSGKGTIGVAHVILGIARYTLENCLINHARTNYLHQGEIRV